MSDDDDVRSQNDLRRLQGTRLGEAFIALMESVEEEPAKLSIAEWRVLVAKWMTRPVTIENFYVILGWFEDPTNTSFSVGGKVVTVLPGQCRAFVRAFQVYAAVDQKHLLVEVMRDAITYHAFVLAGTRRPQSESVKTVGDIGI